MAKTFQVERPSQRLRRSTLQRHVVKGFAFRVLFAAAGLLIELVPTFADDHTPGYKWGKPIEWSDGNGPEAREHGAFIVDENRQRAILIGGSGYRPQFSPLADVWELQLTTDRWRRLTPVASTPLGGSRRVAQLPRQTKAYLFGGYKKNQATHNELICVDFSNETPTFETIWQTNPPPGRCLHAFAYDSDQNQFLLFGGVDSRSGTILNDLWRMSLQNGRALWTRLEPKDPPSARYGFSWGYDSATGQLIVFGGAQGLLPLNPANDTWVLSTRA